MSHFPYSDLKNYIIKRLEQLLEISKKCKFRSCAEGFEESIEYVKNDCIGDYNHYGSIYHRLPYDMYKTSFGPLLSEHMGRLRDMLIISIMDSGELIEIYVNEQRKHSLQLNTFALNCETQKRLDFYYGRYDKEISQLKHSLISSKKVKAMAAVWVFLNVYENYYFPCMKYFDKVFSNIKFRDYDSWTEASLLMKFNTVYPKNKKSRIDKTDANDSKPDPLIPDFYFIRNSLAHSNVDFIDKHTIRFSDRKTGQTLDIPIEDFIEYPRLMNLKTGFVSFLYECIQLSLLMEILKEYNDDSKIW